MPKLKSHRGACKRFRKTAGGIKRKGAYRNHILTKKSPKQRRQLRVSCTHLKPCDARLAERMLNGG